MELNYTGLGQRIKTLRKEKGLTQSVLAEQVRVETSNISHIERGVSKVSLGTLVRIALALEVTVDDLLCFSYPYEREAYENDILRATRDCSSNEIHLIANIVRAVKLTLREKNRGGIS